MTSKFTELAVDCADPRALAGFWCSVLGYEVQDESDGLVTIGSPLVPEGRLRPGPVPPTLTFVRVPEGKTVKNRVHLDVRVGADRREAEVARLIGLGATELWRQSQGPYEWVTLADPQGNEFCVS